MKAKFITLIISVFILISGNLFAESNLVKLSFYTSNGKYLEFYSKTESILEEYECLNICKLFGIKLAEDLNAEVKPAFNIQDFVKPEKEVVENDIDTKAIFNEIIRETYHGK
jgi:hypothetical protein